ncbi:hypothetical protein HOD24_00365 [Candidatus Peregrinibacteria bacterium]|nr:hypothetical protein [Candidatus Peregrinibacteria bacterium]
MVIRQSIEKNTAFLSGIEKQLSCAPSSYEVIKSEIDKLQRENRTGWLQIVRDSVSNAVDSRKFQLSKELLCQLINTDSWDAIFESIFIRLLIMQEDYKVALWHIYNSKFFKGSIVAKKRLELFEEISFNTDSTELLEQIRSDFPEEEIARWYLLMHRATKLVEKGELDAGNDLAIKIQPTDSDLNMHIGRKLADRGFIRHGANLICGATDQKPGAFNGAALEMLRIGCAREASQIIENMFRDNAPQNKGTMQSSLTTLAKSAALDPVASERFKNIILILQKQEQHIDVKFMTKLKKIASSRPRKQEAPTRRVDISSEETEFCGHYARSSFFKDPHRMLRAHPIDRTAAQVAKKSK